jgi:hypothetical protein
MSVAHPQRRTFLALGWEAARANLIPGLCIQAFMLVLLVGYYLSPALADFLGKVALFKLRHGLLFVLVAAAAAGALLPELFLILFFQGGRASRQNVRNLCCTIPIWAFDGFLVDLLYRSQAAWFGNGITLPVVLAKICVDQFGYNPLFAAPFGVLTYEWKNCGFSLESLGRGFTWMHYRDKVIPTLLATWAVWIPLMAMIYSLPLVLQFPLFSLALSFWVLLLTYMTNSFAARRQNSQVIPMVTSTPVAETIS